MLSPITESEVLFASIPLTAVYNADNILSSS
jgi:hypothetical protein